MSVALLELAAAALDDLLGEVVFLGGATIGIWLTDPAGPPARATDDVDVVVEVTSRSAFHAFEDRLRARLFRGDQRDGVICRWRHASGLVLDAMPADASILGFSNRWPAAAIPHAATRALPSGASIRAVPPAYLLATKLEAFKGRGRGDFHGSRDFADIVALVDGRAELVEEVASSAPELRRYVAAELGAILDDARSVDGVYSALLPDAASQARAERVVVPRLRDMAATPRRRAAARRDYRYGPSHPSR